MTKIYFTYKHIDSPWGGANNFIKALCNEVRSGSEFELVASPENNCNIVFMNQLGTGPGGNGAIYSIRDVKRWRAAGATIAVRAVNLNRHAFPLGPRNLTTGWWRDRQTLKLLNIADVVIFQSRYQQNFFREAGYTADNSVVIHNGAAKEFWSDTVSPAADLKSLRIISSTASPRQTKRHDLIAMLSMCDGVEVVHFGAWPAGLSSGRVVLRGMRPREEIAQEMQSCHLFLHTAIKDPCPNAIFEAVCSGLPVIFNPGQGSSSEIVGPCGIPLDVQNPQNTIEFAKSNLAHLRQAVIENRYKYTISNAAEKYLEEFRKLASIPLQVTLSNSK